VTSALNIVSGLLRYAVKREVIDRNVCRDLDRDDRPGVKRVSEPRYLDAVEVERLLAALTDTFRPVAAACAYAGLRASEALGLRWEDLDLDAGLLSVARQLDDDGTLREDVKTPSLRATVPMLPVLARELRAHRSRQAERDLRLVHRSALVFTTANGKPQSRRNALRALHAAGDAAGLNPPGEEKVGLHDLRHSLVGLALDAGLSLAEVAVLARHANAKVTGQVYAGLSESGRAGIADKLLDAGIGR
jgi:integrase